MLLLLFHHHLSLHSLVLHPSYFLHFISSSSLFLGLVASFLLSIPLNNFSIPSSTFFSIPVCLVPPPRFIYIYIATYHLVSSPSSCFLSNFPSPLHPSRLYPLHSLHYLTFHSPSLTLHLFLFSYFTPFSFPSLHTLAFLPPFRFPRLFSPLQHLPFDLSSLPLPTPAPLPFSIQQGRRAWFIRGN